MIFEEKELYRVEDLQRTLAQTHHIFLDEKVLSELIYGGKKRKELLQPQNENEQWYWKIYTSLKEGIPIPGTDERGKWNVPEALERQAAFEKIPKEESWEEFCFGVDKVLDTFTSYRSKKIKEILQKS